MRLELVEPALQPPPSCRKHPAVENRFLAQPPWLDVNCADSAPLWTLG
jgi:hypothetical protein